ncbi:MAG: L-ribulose-5-phosphate 4-epimerase [Solirubrobacteraceae bacterium]|jgi:L-ribulose-5-phosphate 4-epimerase|nr:L-ribulose-5-phosphate 4-epimerase [Solirubrobacteraceae bacterium]
MSTRDLREQVLEANLAIARSGLAKLTWGNTSGIDRDRGLVAIKPSGVPYDELDADTIAVVDLEGTVVEGDMRPSTDTATHLELYRAFAGIGGITHTHSFHATAFAQARRELPFLGTTHADHFRGPVPVTREMRPEEIATDYELNTGRVIVERFAALDPRDMPAVLVAQHGPFAWGSDAADSVQNAVILEAVAELALHTLALAPGVPPASEDILARHYSRKHGPDAYYGNATGPRTAT